MLSQSRTQRPSPARVFRHMTVAKKYAEATSQRGAILLEGLIAILIFSMGILAIVGLQAAAIKTVSDSQYRLEASFLANRLIAEMWSNTDAINSFKLPGGAAPALATWLAEVNGRLPGALTNQPTVTVAGDAATGYTITLRVNWQAAGESTPHNFTTISYINANS